MLMALRSPGNLRRTYSCLRHRSILGKAQGLLPETETRKPTSSAARCPVAAQQERIVSLTHQLRAIRTYKSLPSRATLSPSNKAITTTLKGKVTWQLHPGATVRLDRMQLWGPTTVRIITAVARQVFITISNRRCQVS